MSDDIVERLRMGAGDVEKEGYWPIDPDLVREAADVITQLRATVAELREHVSRQARELSQS